MSVLNPNNSKLPLNTKPCASKFSYSDLKMLDSPALAYQLPMAVIALVDMNAFFAQCEQVRLGRTLEDPVVCCQWSSLIAVSYAARKFGIGRMDTLQSAKDKCPGLIVGHAAVFQKGETHWQYLDGPPNQAIHKVSLDPYRRELRKVFKILSRECDLVEKASVDECYMDLGRLVFAKLMKLFPFLSELEDGDPLPQVPKNLPDGLKWEGKVYLTQEEKFKETDDTLQLNYTKAREKKSISIKDGSSGAGDRASINDWDDICFLIGSQYLYKIRGEVYKELSYTTSGGLATTKTIAKLAGGFVKPDYQTVVRPKAIDSFLHNFELSDITQMGGQLGERLTKKLIPSNSKHTITYIKNNWPLDLLKEELPEEIAVAERVFELCRGNFRQEIKQRTVVKSMMSRKNFLEREPVNTIKDCYDWIRVFVGDLYGRLIELDDENLNLSLLQKGGNEKERIYRPRTVSVQLITSSWSKMSRQTQFPVIKDLDKFRTSLELTAFRLLCELMESSKLTDDDIKYKLLKPNDEHLDQIGTPVLANMGVVVTNFVTTSDVNLIDSYSSSKKDQRLDQEEIKRLFDEVNHFKSNSTSEASKPRKVANSNPYVKKLFQDFQKERFIDSRTEDNTPKSKAEFKEDKDYVKRMFEEFETSLMVDRATTDSTKRQKISSKKILGSTDSHTDNTGNSSASKVLAQEIASSHDSADRDEPVKVLNDGMLEEMMKSRQCVICDSIVEDIFEHRDYHLAVELSSKLNAEYPSSTNRRKKPLAQSRLPFGHTK